MAGRTPSSGPKARPVTEHRAIDAAPDPARRPRPGRELPAPVGSPDSNRAWTQHPCPTYGGGPGEKTRTEPEAPMTPFVLERALIAAPGRGVAMVDRTRRTFGPCTGSPAAATCGTVRFDLRAGGERRRFDDSSDGRAGTNGPCGSPARLEVDEPSLLVLHRSHERPRTAACAVTDHERHAVELTTEGPGTRPGRYGPPRHPGRDSPGATGLGAWPHTLESPHFNS